MATNGPKMTFTGKADLGNGISGQLQKVAAKNQFSQDYYKKEGYLDSSIKLLQEQQQKYEEMSKISDQMNKRDQKAIEKKLAAYEQQLRILQAISDEQEISDEEALQSIKDANALLKDGQQKYIDLLQDEQDILKENKIISNDSGLKYQGRQTKRRTEWWKLRKTQETV